MKFGFRCRFDSIPATLKATILSGPVADAFIATELYADPTVPVKHSSEDFSVVEVDPGKLLPQWRPYFTLLAGTSPPEATEARVIQISGLEIDELGSQANVLRSIYQKGDEAILAEARGMLASGRTEEAVARWVVNERNTLKVVVRTQGATLFRKIAEWRNIKKYGNAVGPTYEQIAQKLSVGMAAEKIDITIIEGVTATSKGFNAAGGVMKNIGKAGNVLGFVVMATQNSPAAATPLPISVEEQIETERARLRLGIPAGANIDRHGHVKPSFYLQVDIIDPHAGNEFDAETEEILWWLGVDISYHYGGVRWTVPGR